MNSKEREEMKGKMMSIRTFFEKLSDDDRMKDKMKTTDGRKMLMKRDDDDGQGDRMVDRVYHDNLGLNKKVSGVMIKNNLLCTETGRDDAVCVDVNRDVSRDVCRDVSRNQEHQDVYSRQMKAKDLVLGDGEGRGVVDDGLARDRRRSRVEQNQTLGGWVGQLSRQTLQGEILLKQGVLQRGILTEYSTEDVQEHVVASQTDKPDDLKRLT